MRAETRALVAGIAPLDDEERYTIAWVLQWIDGGWPLWRTAKPATPPTHLVSYFLLVHDDHVLLVDHRDAGLWLPTGGHVDPGEHPRATVVRELHEELGITAPFVSDAPLFVTRTTTVGASAGHTDVSLWFALRYDRALPLCPDAGEHREARWFHRDAIPWERTDPHLRRFLAKLELSLPTP